MDKTKSCVWCGKTYDEHEDSRKEGEAVPKTPCLLLKSNFTDRKTTSPVRKPKTEQATMTFGEALERVVAGNKITRVEWNTLEEYGILQLGRLRIYRLGEFHIWDVSDGDILANDWIILPDSN